ncbi:hypothetical protein LOK49_LG15G01453 [Camellia lanceoleosa]|uniref:Uncharacterized protein n=1 Tax=Camellia lanceoleosa TaxID=1840588 RepID=A0ACC0F7I4_9ERIC|nr:hypothetical protein LOK49_LG15G01453 [Camellia lanceoleosa]
MDCANIIVDVNCKDCKTPLVWKFVEVPRENITVAAGRFLLYLNKLLMWDGKDMLYADTYKPIENA